MKDHALFLGKIMASNIVSENMLKTFENLPQKHGANLKQS